MGTSIIDLKQASVFFQDGYSLVGAVNNVAGYPTTTTTMTVDLFTGAVADGDTFQIAGDDTIYTISAHTETSGDTTSITFAPGLVVAAVDDAVVTVGPHFIEMVVGEGTLTFSSKREFVYKRNKRALYSLISGDEQPMDVSLDFYWQFLLGDTSDPPTPYEVLTHTGHASTWINTATDPCQPFSIAIRVQHTPVCPGVKKEEILFPDYRWTSIDGNLKDGTLSTKGTTNTLLPVLSRVA